VSITYFCVVRTRYGGDLLVEALPASRGRPPSGQSKRCWPRNPTYCCVGLQLLQGRRPELIASMAVLKKILCLALVALIQVHSDR